MSQGRTEMVMTMVLAELQAEGKELASLSPEEIKGRVDRAVADLQLIEAVVRPQP